LEALQEGKARKKKKIKVATRWCQLLAPLKEDKRRTPKTDKERIKGWTEWQRPIEKVRGGNLILDRPEPRKPGTRVVLGSQKRITPKGK